MTKPINRMCPRCGVAYEGNGYLCETSMIPRASNEKDYAFDVRTCKLCAMEYEITVEEMWKRFMYEQNTQGDSR